MSDAEPFVLSEVDGPVGRLTLNEPARLNPVTRDRIAELGTAAAAMSERDDVRVVIVTGAGRGFCSGADLAAFRIGPRPDTQPASGSILAEGSGLWTLLAMRQPVLAMVNGPAVGFGLELALLADIRVAGVPGPDAQAGGARRIRPPATSSGSAVPRALTVVHYIYYLKWAGCRQDRERAT
jgi:enoyl-CoA hydratase/carnithine racemase